MTLKTKKQLEGQLKGIMSHQYMVNNIQMTNENIKGHKQIVFIYCYPKIIDVNYVTHDKITKINNE